MKDLFPGNSKQRSKPRIIATYDYTNKDRTLFFQSVRYEPKDFKQRRPDPSKPGGWIYNLKGVPRVLYRLPNVKAAVAAGESIYIAEGEKDVDELVKHGFAAKNAPPEVAERCRWEPTPVTFPNAQNFNLTAQSRIARVSTSKRVMGRDGGARIDSRLLAD